MGNLLAMHLAQGGLQRDYLAFLFLSLSQRMARNVGSLSGSLKKIPSKANLPHAAKTEVRTRVAGEVGGGGPIPLGPTTATLRRGMPPFGPQPLHPHR